MSHAKEKELQKYK